MPKKYFEISKEDMTIIGTSKFYPGISIKKEIVTIITIHYHIPSVRNIALNVYYVKASDGIYVYTPVYSLDIAPIIFQNEKSAIKFCKKHLEDRLKELVEF